MHMYTSLSLYIYIYMYRMITSTLRACNDSVWMLVSTMKRNRTVVARPANLKTTLPLRARRPRFDAPHRPHTCIIEPQTG